MNPGNAAAFLLVAVLAGAVLWRGRFPFWGHAIERTWIHPNRLSG